MLDQKKADPFKEVNDYDWSESNFNSAWKEGWNIWECHGSLNGFLQIQRYDNEEDLEDLKFPVYLSCDQDAWDIVWNGTKPHHIKALKIVKEYNPMEYKAILKHIKEIAIMDNKNDYTIEMAEKNQKLYRVYSSITTKYFVDIDAIDDVDAMDKARDLLEDCDFIEIDSSPSGEKMIIEQAELLEDKEVSHD